MTDPVEVYRSSVNTWETDMMGHMNVQFYVDKATDGLLGLGHRLGLGPDYVRRHGARLVARDHHIRFLREQHPGAPLQIFAGVTDAGPRGLRVYEEMRNTGNGEVAATFAAEVELQDVVSREPLALPDSALDAAGMLEVDLPGHGAPRGLGLAEPRPAPTLDEAMSNGMVPTYRGVVKRAMCDEDDRMATRAYMGVVSDAVPNLLAETGQPDRSRTGVGGAALEYRFIYRQTPRPGDLIGLYTGIKDIGSKAYRFCHWMFDLSTGEAVATAEAVAVMLDLEARKAMVIPDDVRAALEKVLVPGLHV